MAGRLHKPECICAKCVAAREARAMFNALHRDAQELLTMFGRFHCRRKLTNGTVITVNIKNPPLPSQQPNPVPTKEAKT